MLRKVKMFFFYIDYEYRFNSNCPHGKWMEKSKNNNKTDCGGDLECEHLSSDFEFYENAINANFTSEVLEGDLQNQDSNGDSNTEFFFFFILLQAC